MATEVFSRQTFDPRKHSAVAISVSDKQPHYTGHTRSEEIPLKSYMVGPNIQPHGLSLRRPITAPVPRRFPNGKVDPQPKILNQCGKWVQSEVPLLIAESQAQPLTATSTFTATLPGSADKRAVRPVTAVFTYNDVSPAVSADAVRDTDTEVTLVKESTINRPRTALSATLRSTLAAQAAPKVDSILTRTGKGGARGTAVGDPDARHQSINAFWARHSGSSFNLGISDLDRVEELGRNVAPGSCNTRLIGSRWKFIPRPVEGDVVYTDFYGRCGEKLDDYYGRMYHVKPSQFNSNRLVGDEDYIKVQASIAGINTLRSRPGLVLDSTIVNAPADRLMKLNASEVRTAKGVHKMNEYARMKPASERELRTVWAEQADA